MPRRFLRFQSLEESVQEIQQLKAGGYTRAGTWDLGQVCEHLAKTLQMSIDGATFKIPFYIRCAARLLLLNTVMRCEPSNLKGVSPDQLYPVRPDEYIEDEAEVEKHINHYVSMVEKLSSSNIELAPRHPVFGSFTREQWLKFHNWHAAHHLSFLLPGKPDSAAVA